jgi:hypothetical protein
MAKLLWQYKPNGKRCQERPTEKWRALLLLLGTGTGQELKSLWLSLLF